MFTIVFGNANYYKGYIDVCLTFLLKGNQKRICDDTCNNKTDISNREHNDQKHIYIHASNIDKIGVLNTEHKSQRNTHVSSPCGKYNLFGVFTITSENANYHVHYMDICYIC